MSALVKVILRRAPLRRGGPTGVDTTVKFSKGEARRFAPTWDMVLRHKSGNLTHAGYIRRYGEILDRVDDAGWDWLAGQADENGVVTLLCLCRDGWFCHTHLIARYAAHFRPEQFVNETGVWDKD